ncbi:MAG TPA: hypothetical protein VIE36_11490 [Methylomirabilota bacterium]
MDSERDRLRDLSGRLLRLHRVLLDRERLAYETRHGAVAAGDLFRLVLDDPQFAWLRALSALIARIDAAVDADAALAADDVEAAFREVYRLLKGGAGGEFQDKYHEALQRSPDVVMAHADVSKMFPPSRR